MRILADVENLIPKLPGQDGVVWLVEIEFPTRLSVLLLVVSTTVGWQQMVTTAERNPWRHPTRATAHLHDGRSTEISPSPGRAVVAVEAGV